MTPVQLFQILQEDVIAGGQALLGATLTLQGCSALIVETESYRAEDDPAAHGYGGVTDRNRVMFEEAGHAYVYFSYGCHWMLNVTCHEPGRGAGILIRAAKPLEGMEKMRVRREKNGKRLSERDLLSGPGKLCQAFGIDRSFNGANLLSDSSPIRIEPSPTALEFVASTRIGIAVGKGHELPWRFIARDEIAWASNPKPKL